MARVASDSLQIVVNCHFDTILLLEVETLSEPKISILKCLVAGHLFVFRFYLLDNEFRILQLLYGDGLLELAFNHLQGDDWCVSHLFLRLQVRLVELRIV